MPTPGASAWGLVSRGQPQPANDGLEREQRFGRFGEAYAVNLVPTKHAVADEGAYFTVNNAQTGIATPAAPTAFSATAPFLLIYNTDSPSNPAYKRIYWDYALLVATAAGTAGASVQFAITLDNGNRYSSGGTNLTNNITNPNMDVGASRSVAQVYAGAITAAAASASARTAVGNRFWKGAIPVIGDTYVAQFGGVDAPHFLGISTILTSLQNLPPVIIGPNQSALLHLWLPSQSAASSYAPELGWTER